MAVEKTCVIPHLPELEHLIEKLFQSKKSFFQPLPRRSPWRPLVSVLYLMSIPSTLQIMYKIIRRNYQAHLKLFEGFVRSGSVSENTILDTAKAKAPECGKVETEEFRTRALLQRRLLCKRALFLWGQKSRLGNLKIGLFCKGVWVQHRSCYRRETRMPAREQFGLCF